MKTSHKGLDLIKEFEGFRSEPYLCPANVWTIGYGTTRYPSGEKVKKGDPSINEYTATEYLMYDLRVFEKAVDSLVRDDITQHQFDALVSFAYNLGSNSLKGSSLLKKVNANPNDKTISHEFEKWVYSDGKKLKGLVLRRLKESMIYFSS